MNRRLLALACVLTLAIPVAADPLTDRGYEQLLQGHQAEARVLLRQALQLARKRKDLLTVAQAQRGLAQASSPKEALAPAREAVCCSSS